MHRLQHTAHSTLQQRPTRVHAGFQPLVRCFSSSIISFRRLFSSVARCSAERALASSALTASPASCSRFTSSSSACSRPTSSSSGFFDSAAIFVQAPHHVPVPVPVHVPMHVPMHVPVPVHVDMHVHTCTPNALMTLCWRMCVHMCVCVRWLCARRCANMLDLVRVPSVLPFRALASPAQTLKGMAC